MRVAPSRWLPLHTRIAIAALKSLALADDDRDTAAHDGSNHVLQVSAERFWALRVDEGFDHYFSSLANQTCEFQQHDETPQPDGSTKCVRAYKLVLKENPVPPRLRNMMGKSEFAFTVHSTFHKEKFDEAHPCAASMRAHPN